MFVLKSAFWLSVGFILVAPHGVDLGARASAVKDQAIAAGMQAGEQLIVSQIFAGSPTSVIATSSTALPSAKALVQPSLPPDFVFPRQRPAALG